MKLSIIIPVYRVEATLNRCVGSVVSQSFADFELILVDDGSPDLCPQLCDDWAAKDDRIKVVHKNNGGLSDARNAGLGIATAPYVTFVDSDDFIGDDTLRPLMEILSGRPEVDILEYPVMVAYGSPRQHRLSFPDQNYSDMEEYWLKGCAYQHTYAWNKIYRRSLFSDVQFPVGRVFEDAQTLPLLLRKARLVRTCDQGLYYYTANPRGITATANGEALLMLLEAHVRMLREIGRRDADFYRYYMHVLNIQMDVTELTGAKPILPFVKQDTSCLSGIPKLKALLLNILGVRKLCRLNKTIHKIWRNH